MESLTWTTPRTRATFGTTAEEAETTKLLAFNQGLYNLWKSAAKPKRFRVSSGPVEPCRNK